MNAPTPDAEVVLTRQERARFDLREWWDYVLTDAPDVDYKTILANLERFACEAATRIVADRLAQAQAPSEVSVQWRVETDTTEDEFGEDERDARAWLARCAANPEWEPATLMRRTVSTVTSEWVPIP